MHVVLGDGQMTRKELSATLTDLWDKDEKAGQAFWFVLQGKSDPTDTDKALVTWLEKNEIYYQIVTDDPEAVDPIYAQPQETHSAKKLGQKVTSLLESMPEEGESAEILALFVDTSDATAAEDKWLNTIIASAYDAGYPTRALNDGLVEIDLGPEAEEAEAEPEPAAPAKKSVAKKAPAKKAAAARPADTSVSDDDEDETESQPPTSATPRTRAELEELDATEVKEIAAEMGIVLPPRTRATTYIDHILGEAKGAAPAAEVSLEGSSGPNGDLDYAVLADAVADSLISKLKAALSS